MSVGHASFFVSNPFNTIFVFRIIFILTRLHDGLNDLIQKYFTPF